MGTTVQVGEVAVTALQAYPLFNAKRRCHADDPTPKVLAMGGSECMRRGRAREGWMMARRRLWGMLAVVALSVPATASAFCGFYVGGADQSLYNDATMVVMMREAGTTVLSMQNTYQGPPEDFAMVIPVPVVLAEDDVRTLSPELFTKIDRLAAPRLVEYWEQNPCSRPRRYRRSVSRMTSGARGDLLSGVVGGRSRGVTVEAEFEVAEYDIVILSARDSDGLDGWLRDNNYNIPDGAGRVLRPYVEAGTKFFVARVDIGRVRMEGGRAKLSPLRVHYDSDQFSLPVRLGLLNSAGTQDLIVHILAKDQRFEVANYDNVLIPTNIRVNHSVRRHFGEFYTTLFDATLARHPGAVVTEYSWNASSCDPCPGPSLNAGDLATLGADVLRSDGPSRRGRGRVSRGGAYTLTRLHYRYTEEELGEDLVFRAADAIVGGRGAPSRAGRLDPSVSQGRTNTFQGRYAILHPWTGAIACADPQRGRWGGPLNRGRGAATPAVGLTSRPRSARPLGQFVRDRIPALGVRPQRRGSASQSSMKPTAAAAVPVSMPAVGSPTSVIGAPTAAVALSASSPRASSQAMACSVSEAGLPAATTLALPLLVLALRRRRG